MEEGKSHGESPMGSEILLAYALQSPSGTFTQDFNTNFLRTSNSGTGNTELVHVSQNSGSRGLQDPNPPAEAPESSGSSSTVQLYPKVAKGETRHILYWPCNSFAYSADQSLPV